MGLLVLWPVLVGAGELVFTDGSRLEAELVAEMLVLATPTGRVEVAPEEVAVVTPGEVRTWDGRVLRGTPVGGTLKVATGLGELGVPMEELTLFRAGESLGPGGRAPRDRKPRPAEAKSVSSPGIPGDRGGLWPAVSEAPARSSGPTASGPEAARAPADPVLPTAPGPAVGGTAVSGREASDLPAAAPAGGGPATVAALAPARPPKPGAFLEVVTESLLRRDALEASPAVGRVGPGERVTVVDVLDRRLRILNFLWDLGYWIRVRRPDGTLGWLPADRLRPVR